MTLTCIPRHRQQFPPYGTATIFSRRISWAPRSPPPGTPRRPASSRSCTGRAGSPWGTLRCRQRTGPCSRPAKGTGNDVCYQGEIMHSWGRMGVFVMVAKFFYLTNALHIQHPSKYAMSSAKKRFYSFCGKITMGVYVQNVIFSPGTLGKSCCPAAPSGPRCIRCRCNSRKGSWATRSRGPPPGRIGRRSLCKKTWID